MQKYLHTTVRLWKLLSPFHKHFYFQLFFIIISQLINIWIVLFSAKILTNIVEKNFNLAIQNLYLLTTLLFSRILISYISNIHSVKYINNSIQQYLENFSFKNVFNLNISQYIEDHSAIKLQVINRGEDAVENIISTFILTMIPVITQVIFSIGAIFYYSPLTAIVYITFISIVIIWEYKFTNFHRPFIKKNMDNWDEQRKIRTESFQHLSLIKINGVESNYLKAYLKNRLKKIEHTIFTIILRVKHNHKRWSFLTLNRIVTTLIIVYLASIGRITVGTVYAIWSWINDANSQILEMINIMRNIPIRFVELEKYLNIIDRQKQFDEEGKENFKNGDIIFENLEFRYPSSENLVLKKLNFTIKHGEKTAFVGTSGSGKSSIIKLLLRIYDYQNGDIKIGDISLKDISAKNLRHHIGYVEQHVDLFDTNIKDNILFGLLDKNISEEKIDSAIKASRIDQFKHRLDKGLETLIGERGVKLSGGERQRIGIARALIKDPEILIFDEATASLDTENEKFIQEAIDEASKGRTSIIIAHRLSTVQNADKIIVMHFGEIVGIGTHSELLENNTYYQNLIKHQH